jgi:hypothetical protein
LLAAIALLAISVWAKYSGFRKIYFIIPSAIMFAITLSAMAVQIHKFFVAKNVVLGGLSVLLFVLAVYFTVRGGKFVWKLNTRP